MSTEAGRSVIVAHLISDYCEQVSILERGAAHVHLLSWSASVLLEPNLFGITDDREVLQVQPGGLFLRVSFFLWLAERAEDNNVAIMDIFNRPPAISEDTLQYYLYPPSGSSDKASVTAFAACIDSFLDALTAGMIWHRDAFQLKFASDPDTSDGYLLEGRMRVGDCVDDEWCVVWLLKEVSAKWDFAIRLVKFRFPGILVNIDSVTVSMIQMANFSSSKQQKHSPLG